MPKRPSALALTSDGQTILCGDKFGDVYSLPLIPGEYVRKIVETPVHPAATPLTVHTKGNLRTLEMQKLSAEKRAQDTKQEQTAPVFEHHNIIGHVSVLTDLVCITESGRSYILTGDRDEHIRVSRGIPQAHVIEQLCLGHTSLVSKLCVPSWAPHLLVSGDADGNLFVWDWKTAKIHQTISLEESMKSEVVVRGIWDVSLEQPGASGRANVILVSLEGSSEILCYTVEDNTLRAQDSIKLSGNVLGLIESQGSVIASVDTVREVGSTDIWKSSSGALLESFRLNIGPDGLKCVPAENSVVASINSFGTSDIAADLNEKKQKEFNNSLYNLVNMKKRSGHEE
ncbi:tRNA (guanine-N(7)-)-methyltransferase non-catalytic subunit trm82 [Penicillium verhagenii]|uniref:tRNA (guanine-N(7)-)-methyltransferase non-catalytic subunit trm82 n=1 Tax=Penicillium verhagenii TaxID=1562060 RepID=UPI0025451392|nr:tRNA (guanine-N(7)-)-methyltransferase non-catalytic subunit trm82 [Penicillium verhagenii]KAJ5934168.1 tRNA (guanine-N(7)-)-methyltransferase non-catalytic subunit trm82 [Penicillium verhagenii]